MSAVRSIPLVFALFAAVATCLSAQARPGTVAGPIIEDFGAVFPVKTPAFATDLRHSYRVVFDVALGADSPSQRNARIESIARFLNMQAQAGVPADKMDIVLVVHGTAGKDLLRDDAYRARHQTDNPNAELLRRLMDAGVRVVLCGQTAAARDLPADQLLPGAQVALSAMTALVQLQNQGYALIPW